MKLFSGNKKENFGIKQKKNRQVPWIQLASFEQLDIIKSGAKTSLLYNYCKPTILMNNKQMVEDHGGKTTPYPWPKGEKWLLSCSNTTCFHFSMQQGFL